MVFCLLCQEKGKIRIRAKLFDKCFFFSLEKSGRGSPAQGRFSNFSVFLAVSKRSRKLLELYFSHFRCIKQRRPFMQIVPMRLCYFPQNNFPLNLYAALCCLFASPRGDDITSISSLAWFGSAVRDNVCSKCFTLVNL